jgi:hypothetical protein
MEKTKNKMNWNTLFITLNIGVVGFFGHKLVDKVETTHDAVIAQNVQIADIRSRQTATDADVAAIKISVASLTLEVARWKDKHQ